MATDTKWTPGPWHTDRPCVTWQNGFGLWTRPVHTSVAGRGFMVAGRTEAEATANARIVAAAPDLYAALELAEFRLRSAGNMLSAICESDPTRDRREAANRAIAAANDCAVALRRARGAE